MAKIISIKGFYSTSDVVPDFMFCKEIPLLRFNADYIADLFERGKKHTYIVRTNGLPSIDANISIAELIAIISI